MNQAELKIYQVAITDLNPATYNPRKWDESAIKNLRESVERFGLIDPIIVNKSENRKNIVIGGHFRLKIAKDLGLTTVPVVYVHIPEIEQEKELNLRLNRNTGDWDFELLKEFDVELLLDVPTPRLFHVWSHFSGALHSMCRFVALRKPQKVNKPSLLVATCRVSANALASSCRARYPRLIRVWIHFSCPSDLMCRFDAVHKA